MITHQMSPSATILVSYVRQDGEIVADYITITVDVSLENKVSCNIKHKIVLKKSLLVFSKLLN